MRRGSNFGAEMGMVWMEGPRHWSRGSRQATGQKAEGGISLRLCECTAEGGISLRLCECTAEGLFMRILLIRKTEWSLVDYDVCLLLIIVRWALGCQRYSACHSHLMGSRKSMTLRCVGLG
jgi:hypothetical protein